MIKEYVKKPVKIEAFHVTKEVWKGWWRTATMTDFMPGWVGEAYNNSWDAKGRKLYNKNGCWFISTLEGDHEVKEGDYIIRGVRGELYPCKPDIFAMSYSEVKK